MDPGSIGDFGQATAYLLNNDIKGEIRVFKLIISIHMPKCAGTSLRRALVGIMRPHIQMDYGDRINDYSSKACLHRRNSRRILKRQIRRGKFNPSIVHGHFYAAKYLGLGLDMTWITVFRDPKELLYSYYEYLRRHPALRAAIVNKAREFSSFEDFIEDTDFQNIMSRMIYPLGIEDFELVGMLDAYSTFLQELEHLLNRGPIHSERDNANPKGSQYNFSVEVVRRIAELNASDMELIDRVRTRINRSNQRRSHSVIEPGHLNE